MKKKLFIIIPILSLIICSLLFFTNLDLKISDTFQKAIPTTEEKSDVVMIAIDDDAVSRIGTFPFSRDVYSRMLTNLKELGAYSVVFDLSFLDKSQALIDEKYVKENLPVYVEDEFSQLSDDTAYLLDDILSGGSIEDFYDNYLYQSDYYMTEIINLISRVVDPVDEKLAKSIYDFGNTYLTLTFDDFFEPEDYIKDYLEKNIALKNIVDLGDTKTPSFDGVQPAIQDFLKNAKSAGFVNAPADEDGYLRRVNLLFKYNGNYYPQLILLPILEKLGNPQIKVSDKYFIIGDMKIPRAEDGSIFLKYPKNKKYKDYNKISLASIYFLSEVEDAFVQNLEIMNDSGFFYECDEDSNPYEFYTNAEYIYEEILNNGEDPDLGITYDEYLYNRGKYLESVKAFLTEDTLDYFCQIYPDDVDYIQELFDATMNAFETYISQREKCSSKVENAVCIVGTNASSTTDYGVMPYEEQFPLPGVHYTLANMLLTNDFVDDSPWIVSLIIALIMCFAYSITSHKLQGTIRQIVMGIITLAVTIGGILLYYIITHQYIGVVVPAASVLLTYVATIVTNFLTASHDKKFITNAFSQCLSKEVVSEIVANPSSFKLGGQKINMTAMFTDIQKFSGFSELLTAAQLVALLNYYLTKMSDIIMDERGTVDKYEGDAIIALVGAPVKMEDHAQRACAAAIKMKAAEAVMNKEIEKIAAEEKPEEMEQDLYDAFKIMVANKRVLFTRIGLNSGEMVAGYMGSENKKNYTMMGNNVNLASRLEGVNKQYSTAGILISESTRELLGDRFVVRSLDRVRVVNVNTPIRLYELICEKADADENTLKYYENWEIALKNFETKQYDKALEQFKKLADYKKDDNVAAYYIKLTEKFFIKGKYPVAADDVGVEYQPEDNVFKLMSK